MPGGYSSPSGQRGEKNKGGICLHPGLEAGPTHLGPQPGWPHPNLLPFSNNASNAAS